MEQNLIILSGIVMLILGTIIVLLRGKYFLEYIDAHCLKLKRLTHSMDISWVYIKAIYSSAGNSGKDLHRYKFLTLITEDNKKIDFMIREKNIRPIIEKIYDIFLNNLIARELGAEKTRFEHVIWWVKRKKKILKVLPILLIILVLLWAIHIYQMGFVLSDPTGPIVIAITIAGVIYLFATKRRNNICSLCVNENMITFDVGSGRRETRSFNDINRFEIERFRGKIVFNDGFCLKDLEKLSYWPILREYLLSKLEPSKNETNRR